MTTPPSEGGPARFVLRVETPLTPGRAWERIWDLDRHTEVIPLTTVATTPPGIALAVGVEFCARTALGPVGFDDSMRVVEWAPPTTGDGHAVVTKTGSVVGGRIEVTVAPFASGSVITWRQQVEVPWLPSPLSGIAARAGARLAAPGYRSVLGRLLDRP